MAHTDRFLGGSELYDKRSDVTRMSKEMHPHSYLSSGRVLCGDYEGGLLIVREMCGEEPSLRLPGMLPVGNRLTLIS